MLNKTQKKQLRRLMISALQQENGIHIKTYDRMMSLVKALGMKDETRDIWHQIDAVNTQFFLPDNVEVKA